MNKNFFTFKNLNGEYSALANDLRTGTPAGVFGVTEPHKYLLASLSPYKTLYVTPDYVTAEKAYKIDIGIFGQKMRASARKDEVILYKDALPRTRFSEG